MHLDSEYLIEKLLWNYYQLGEKKFVKSYKTYKKYLVKAYNNGTIRKELEDVFND